MGLQENGECSTQSAWIGQIENLLTALEAYRMEQEQAIRSLSDVLERYGIFVPVEEIRQMDTKEIRTVIKKKTEAR